MKYEIYFVYKHFIYIHFVYISSDLQKVYIINILCTICIQNSYRMYVQIIVCRMDPLFQHIFDPFVVQFIVNHCGQLRLETC